MSWGNVALSDEIRHQLVLAAVAQVRGLPLDVIRDRERLLEPARRALLTASGQMNISLPAGEREKLITQIVSQIGGLGFINLLLPPARDDLIEIAVNPDGSVWVWPKNSPHFVKTDLRPDLQEVWRAVDALLAPIGRSISEAEPSVEAKLPRMTGLGGARVHIIHPELAPGTGYPAINVRLFEPKPVPPAQIVAWGMAPDFVMAGLLEAVRKEYRILVIGGTVTGKTTFLSSICQGIPKKARVLKVEDPEEIWLDHPHVVTLEARPASSGSSVEAYELKDLVDDTMRMSPRWLIVGEVRRGDAAMALFRAQMSDHPGLSTFHAQSPADAVGRMAVLMMADAGVEMNAGVYLFERAIDVIVQVGWEDGQRRVMGVYETDGLESGGAIPAVQFRTLYRQGEAEIQPFTRRERRLL
ncbi:MAG: CpaF family protein [Chloroflexi bacterium]|jgi:pilus assembly protein CpaF|nr:CpaF family protein [Chloroflexota bacterium]